MTVGKLPYTFYYICNSDVLDLRPLWILFDWICGGLLRHSATILSCLAQAHRRSAKPSGMESLFASE